MQKFLIAFIVAFLFAVFSISASNANVKKAPLKVYIDSTKIIVKTFNAGAINKYRQDKDFNYNGKATGEPSFWERFWQWLWSKIGSLFNGVPYAGTILQYSLLALAIALLIYIVIKALGIDAGQLFRGESTKLDIPYNESLENIHEINFDNEIEKAIATHNYRLAVRLLYLRSLKQLSDNKLIHWQIDKTNANYIFELTDPLMKDTFGLLTRQFEYIWYGNFAIDKYAFANISLLFQNFKNQLP